MWIVSDKTGNLPVFSKQFTVEKNLQNATLNLSTLGIFRIKINGKEIDEYFMPAWTNYNKYVNLCTYDITSYLKKGENLLEITVASGWYSGRLGYTGKSNVYGTEKALYAELSLSYPDKKETVVTDKTWKVASSNILSSDLFDGETVDFNTENPKYDKLPCVVETDIEKKFEPYFYESVTESERLTGKVLFQDKTTLRLDFCQNFAGFLSFVVKGKKGKKVVVKYAEVLDENGNLYTENLRSAKVTDTLILSGGKDIFSPRFTYHGFRYAEITTEDKTDISEIYGVVLTQNIDYGGEFTCSDKIMNKVYENVKWGQKSNFIGIPTDCPQRDERLGWTGDAEVFANTAMYNANAEKFFDNYLKLIRTDVLPDGKIPSFAPFFIPVSDSTAGVPGWADVISVLPYTHYLHYGDKKILEENLPYAKTYIEYFLSHSTEYLTDVKNPFGDWLSVIEKTDIPVINQCFFAQSCWLVGRSYVILGDTEQARKYLAMYDEVRNAFRKAYLKDGKIQSDTETAYAFAFQTGLVSKDEIHDAFVGCVKRNGEVLTTGFVGVKYLLPALDNIGETDLAYRLAKTTAYPSWGYTVENGATTIWDRWNGYTKENGFETPKMNSFNHYSLGSCVEWYYSGVLGIRLTENKKILVSPSFTKELDFAKGAYQSKDGKISVEWTNKNGRIYLTVEGEKNVEFDVEIRRGKVASMMRVGNTVKATVDI